MRLNGLILAICAILAPLMAALAQEPDSPGPELIRRHNEAAVVEIILPAEMALAPALAKRLRGEAEATIAGFLTDAEIEQKQRLQELPGVEPVPFSLSVTFRPTLVTADVISLLKTVDLYTGGAHGSIDFEGIIFDRRRNTLLQPEQIFTGGEGWPANLKRLEALAAAALREQKRERLSPELALAGVESWVDDLQLPLHGMTLLPSDQPGLIGGIAFDIAPYAAGSYAEGAYRVVLPANEIRDMAGSEWQALFGGKPDLLTTVPTNDPDDADFLLLREPKIGQIVEPSVTVQGEAPVQFLDGNALPYRVLRQGKVLSEGTITADRKAPASGAAIGMVPFRDRIDLGRGAGNVVIRLGRRKPVDIPVTTQR
jgi:hypothetical protein